MSEQPENSSPQPGVPRPNRGMSLMNAMYYAFKPMLPVHVRYTMRRLRARYKLLTARDWPIMESAASKPPGWRGWPAGKQFAVVLTHDVEGPLGLERTPALAALEEKHGFRSSFNFIPEGDYRVTKETRIQLSARGFEVGVHDLRHDGSLYRSRRAFGDAAKVINRYLKDWDAVGFRAGFMFHNLEWLKELEVEYDASTFDTDPFEPQPEGMGTIFPFWVPRAGGGGYMELPYTLPQDSTLFLILRESAFDIWKQKLDWVAAQGGMVLLNVHPDYVAFDRQPCGPSEFSAEIYAKFLTYLKERYAGAYWQALPREAAHYSKKILVP